MFKLLVFLSIIFQSREQNLKQVYTSNKGIVNTDDVYAGSYLVSNQQFINEPFIDTIIGSNIHLDVSTQIFFSNYSIGGDLSIDSVKLLTNLKAIYLSPSSFKNFSIIKLKKCSIFGSLLIKNSEISNQINGNIINLESSLMTSIHLDNVVVEKDLIINTNTLSHSILIENSIIKGNLIIDGVRIFTGTVIVKNTNVNGLIRIERVWVSKRIDLDNSVTSPNPIRICPNPFYTNYNGESFNGCYSYMGKVDTFNQAVSKCNSIGASLITIRNRKIAEDLPKIYTAFSPFYYWVRQFLMPMKI